MKKVKFKKMEQKRSTKEKQYQQKQLTLHVAVDLAQKFFGGVTAAGSLHAFKDHVQQIETEAGVAALRLRNRQEGKSG